MTDWTRGYSPDSIYTVSYQTAQAPAHLALVCALMGVAWEPPEDLAVLELGCGRGYTANALAASNARWRVVGIDFNPAHIAEARAFAAEAGIGNAEFIEADFAEMTEAEADRLPEFDVVTLHGLWTWVSDPVREGVLRLLRRRLKAGGLAMASYNALPGFGEALGLQRLVRTAAANTRGTGPERVVAALGTARGLAEAGAAHLGLDGWAGRFTDPERQQDPAYLAHELLTGHWRPAFHGDVAEAFATARLDFVGSATLVENFTDLCLSRPQREIHDAMPEGAPRELVKDLCLKRSFRRDVFVRGARRVPREAALDAIVLGLATEAPVKPVLAGEAFTATLPPELAAPIRAALREGPRSIGELRALIAGRGLGGPELVATLVGSELAVPVLRPGAGPTAESRGFNRVAARRFGNGGLTRGSFALAAPALGGGLLCGALELEVVAALQGGEETRDAAAIAQRLLPPDAPPEMRERGREMIGRVLAERMRAYRQLGAL
jgi:SAM-dependent methyltransferase